MKFKQEITERFFKEAKELQDKLAKENKTIDYKEYLRFKEWFIGEARLLYKGFSNKLILIMWESFQKKYGLKLKQKTENGKEST